MNLQASKYPDASNVKQKKRKNRAYRPTCDEKVLGATGYLKGERIAMVRDALLKDLCRKVIYLDDRQHFYSDEKLPLSTSFSILREKVGPERFLILTVIALTIADLGAGDNALEWRITGKELRKDAFNAIFGDGQEGFKLLCDLAGVEFDYIKMLGHAMLRFMSERMISENPAEQTGGDSIKAEASCSIDCTHELSVKLDVVEKECEMLGEAFEELVQMPLYLEEVNVHVAP